MAVQTVNHVPRPMATFAKAMEPVLDRVKYRPITPFVIVHPHGK
jgi:hypothetical protein